MKRKLSTVLVGIACVVQAEAVEAGVINFAPSAATVEVGTPINVVLSVSLGGLTSFEGAAIFIGADGVTDLLFAVSPGWSSTFNVTGPLFDTQPGLYEDDVLIQSDNAFPLATDGIVLGTLTIDTTGMVAGGPHTVVIDQNESFLGFFGGEEPIIEDVTGSFSFMLTPEPSSLLLLLLGGAGLRRRSR